MNHESVITLLSVSREIRAQSGRALFFSHLKYRRYVPWFLRLLLVALLLVGFWSPLYSQSVPLLSDGSPDYKKMYFEVKSDLLETLNWLLPLQKDTESKLSKAIEELKNSQLTLEQTKSEFEKGSEEKQNEIDKLLSDLTRASEEVKTLSELSEKQKATSDKLQEALSALQISRDDMVSYNQIVWKAAMLSEQTRVQEQKQAVADKIFIAAGSFVGGLGVYAVFIEIKKALTK